MASPHEDDFIGGEAALVGDPVDETLVIADEEETGRMTVALDEGVRRQGRRQTHQLHARGDSGAIATVAGLVKGRRQGPDDAGRQVVGGGEGFRRRYHVATAVGDDDGVGVGPAGVDAKGEAVGAGHVDPVSGFEC